MDWKTPGGYIRKSDDMWPQVARRHLHPEVIDALLALDEGRAVHVDYKLIIDGMRSKFGDALRIDSPYGAWRTAADQDKLLAQGYVDQRKRVTKAGAFQSYHNYGLAVDLVWTAWGWEVATVGAERIDLNSKAGWLRTGLPQFFESRGFFWGGRWTTLPDYGHFELPLDVPVDNALVVPGWWDLVPATSPISERSATKSRAASLGLLVVGGITLMLGLSARKGR